MDTLAQRGSPLFATTQWTLVFAAGGGNVTAKREALASLCQAYWEPIHGYILRRGYGEETAKDLTQEFFARLLKNDWLTGLTREGSKFRAFLLVAVKRFLAVENEHRCAQKRGGGVAPIPLGERDSPEAVATEDTPEQAYDRSWALIVIDRAIGRLRAEAQASGRAVMFERLSRFLPTDPEPGAYDQAADALGITRATVAMTVYRLRIRLREQIRTEVADTLSDTRLVEDEMRALIRALRA
ncbi:MAG TPA: sigma-70 family RNA polymerase sigma factor [Opitutaceae bacterium]|jgi:RNA polymerase sigma-70 factor (ECF subfamily)